jgi:hypothetical protein
VFTKEDILSEIRRTAKLNGGVPLGDQRFFDETGIDKQAILRYWPRRGDAVKEAGLTPNRLTPRRDEDDVLGRLAAFVSELGHFPIWTEIDLRARQDPGFQWASTLRTRYGGKVGVVERLRCFCEEHEQKEVAAICAAVSKRNVAQEVESADLSSVGYVYLMKHGSRREYKIGRTNNPIRREGEIRTELPEALLPIHQIKTDDPAGVEHYWHTRFADKRKNGEWFALTVQDIKAFKKWRKIC